MENLCWTAATVDLGMGAGLVVTGGAVVGVDVLIGVMIRTGVVGTGGGRTYKNNNHEIHK